MNILYEDASIVVLDKPAGLSSEEGVPAALRQRWNAPDAFVGVVHRLDTGVSGLMVFARTPGAAAALSRQITQSQNAYAVQDGRAEGRAEEPQFIKQYRAVIAGGPDEQPLCHPMPVWRQAVILYAATNGLLRDVPLDRVRGFVQDFADSLPDALLTEIQSTGTLTGTAAEQIREALETYKEQVSAAWQA